MSEKRSSRTAISKLKTGAIEIEDIVGIEGELATSDDEPRGDHDDGIGTFEVVHAAAELGCLKDNDDAGAGNMTGDEGNADNNGISDVQFLPAMEDCREKRRVWTMYHNVYYEVGFGEEERVKAGSKRKRPGKTGGSKPKRAKLAPVEGDSREAVLPDGKN